MLRASPPTLAQALPAGAEGWPYRL